MVKKMIKVRAWYMSLLLFLFSGIWSNLSLAEDTVKQIHSTWSTLDEKFVYGLCGLLFLMVIISFGVLHWDLTKADRWSLSDALSEPMNMTPLDATGQPLLDKLDKPIEIMQLKNSTSRLIALLGGVCLIFIFVGFSCIALCEYAFTGTIEGLDEIWKFLLGGATIFIPYVSNRILKLRKS